MQREMWGHEPTARPITLSACQVKQWPLSARGRVDRVQTEAVRAERGTSMAQVRAEPVSKTKVHQVHVVKSERHKTKLFRKIVLTMILLSLSLNFERSLESDLFYPPECKLYLRWPLKPLAPTDILTRREGKRSRQGTRQRTISRMGPAREEKGSLRAPLCFVSQWKPLKGRQPRCSPWTAQPHRAQPHRAGKPAPSREAVGVVKRLRLGYDLPSSHPLSILSRQPQQQSSWTTLTHFPSCQLSHHRRVLGLSMAAMNERSVLPPLCCQYNVADLILSCGQPNLTPN